MDHWRFTCYGQHIKCLLLVLGGREELHKYRYIYIYLFWCSFMFFDKHIKLTNVVVVVVVEQ